MQQGCNLHFLGGGCAFFFEFPNMRVFGHFFAYFLLGFHFFPRIFCFPIFCLHFLYFFNIFFLLKFRLLKRTVSSYFLEPFLNFWHGNEGAYA